ncbi:MAG: ribonuclease HII [Ignavibacterium sp.]|nr:ribonuclease HII [Ignavibacterium sp.]MDW8375302.1 ribonuclease HII [Ignavibacteriales bacterium]
MRNFDHKFYNKGYNLIAGIDEAGRGPLAGPVVAAAVIFEKYYENPLINDSKKLNQKQREKVFEIIKKESLCWTFSVVSQNTIDKINILNATLLAMKNSVQKLNPQPELILIDGDKNFQYKVETIPIIKGDSLSLSIAAASIVAKVIRDKIMERLDLLYPNYKWRQNKGYPTKSHYLAIKEFGVSPIHRKSFLKKYFNDESAKI